MNSRVGRRLVGRGFVSSRRDLVLVPLSAALDLDGQVSHADLSPDDLTVERRVAGLGRHDLHDARKLSGSDLPEVQIGDGHVVDLLEATLERLRRRERGRDVEQLLRGAGGEPYGPAPDDERADDPHHWIEQRDLEVATRDQRDDGEDARQRVGEDVEPRRLEVVVPRGGRGLVVVRGVIVMCVVVMCVVVTSVVVTSVVVLGVVVMRMAATGRTVVGTAARPMRMTVAVAPMIVVVPEDQRTN